MYASDTNCLPTWVTGAIGGTDTRPTASGSNAMSHWTMSDSFSNQTHGMQDAAASQNDTRASETSEARWMTGPQNLDRRWAGSITTRSPQLNRIAFRAQANMGQLPHHKSWTRCQLWSHHRPDTSSRAENELHKCVSSNLVRRTWYSQATHRCSEMQQWRNSTTSQKQQKQRQNMRQVEITDPTTGRPESHPLKDIRVPTSWPWKGRLKGKNASWAAGKEFWSRGRRKCVNSNPSWRQQSPVWWDMKTELKSWNTPTGYCTRLLTRQARLSQLCRRTRSKSNIPTTPKWSTVGSIMQALSHIPGLRRVSLKWKPG